jgi:hypothetical protein
MSDNLRQRRGKKSSDATSTKEEKPTVSSAADKGKSTSIEQLQGARARLVVARERTADLHAAWRNQLFRLSLLIIFITVHQFQEPISSCIAEMKTWNEDAGVSASDDPISGMQAIGILFKQTYCELLGVVTATLLAYFLARGRNAPLELDSWPYMLSSAMVPVQLGFYFHSKQVKSCVGEFNDEDNEEGVRKFPVVVIYHTIVTMAVWFMKSGADQCEEHVKMVEYSIRDLERMDKKLKQKAQLKK